MPTQQNLAHNRTDYHPAPAHEMTTIVTVTVDDAVSSRTREDRPSPPVPLPAARRAEDPDPVMHRAMPGVTTRAGKGTAVVVRVIGEVDNSTAPIVAAALRTACSAACRSRPLVIDLTGVRFFSAAGLTLLITTRRQCQERYVPLRVVAAHRTVLRPLHITGLDVLFDVTPSLADAIRPDIHHPEYG